MKTEFSFLLVEVVAFFPCFSEPLRKDQETYGSDKSTRILTSLLARSVLVPFRFYVLMYPEAVGCRGKIPLLFGERSEPERRTA